MPDRNHGDGDGRVEVVPVVVLSQTFPARPSWIPEIRDFVRRCLAESPLTEEGNRQVGETVFRALLDAAGPTGAIQVSFRIFPDHVEVDVVRSGAQVSSPADIDALAALLKNQASDMKAAAVGRDVRPENWTTRRAKEAWHVLWETILMPQTGHMQRRCKGFITLYRFQLKEVLPCVLV